MAHVGAVRDQQKERWWRRVVAGQPGSGMSVRSYCFRQGVKESAFYWWRATLARRKAPRPKAAFVPVSVVAEEPRRAEDGRIEIALPGGRQIRVSGRVDKQMLVDVLSVLEARPC
jgi:transposase